MAKCYKPVLYSDVRGKMGDVVFSNYKGTTVVRIYSDKYKNRPKLIDTIDKAMNHPITKGEVRLLGSQLLLGLLSWLYKRKLGPSVGEAWEKICKSKKLTSPDMFIGYNLSEILNSIPVADKLIGINNMPDFTKLLITEGTLFEQTWITKMTYNPSTGDLCMEWTTNTFIRGKPDDNAHIIIIYWGPPDFTTLNANNSKPWSTMQVWSSDKESIKRRDGSVTIKIGEKLNPDYITGFLFFTNGPDYSRSISAQIK